MLVSQGHTSTKPGRPNSDIFLEKPQDKNFINLQPAQLIGTFGNQSVNKKNTTEKPRYLCILLKQAAFLQKGNISVKATQHPELYHYQYFDTNNYFFFPL